MKACESSQTKEEHRVNIGCNHNNVPVWRRAIGLMLVYLPIITWPFVLISALLSYYHLKMVGADNLKTLFDFLPKRETHRYNLKNQITMDGTFSLSLAKTRLYWILNCTWYCPVSVGLFEWHAYLVKVIENWWCPFNHGNKENYSNAKIDESFWHIYPEDKAKLHEDDRENPIWNNKCSGCHSANDEVADK
jgi:hypothetical protein